jgi:hypothetical protein
MKYTVIQDNFVFYETFSSFVINYKLLQKYVDMRGKTKVV